MDFSDWCACPGGRERSHKSTNRVGAEHSHKSDNERNYAKPSKPRCVNSVPQQSASTRDREKERERKDRAADLDLKRATGREKERNPNRKHCERNPIRIFIRQRG